MRLTRKEKQVLFELLDNMTEKVQNVEKFDSENYRSHLFNMFIKLRLELKGF